MLLGNIGGQKKLVQNGSTAKCKPKQTILLLNIIFDTQIQVEYFQH
jgi:hypothetical protein